MNILGIETQKEADFSELDIKALSQAQFANLKNSFFGSRASWLSDDQKQNYIEKGYLWNPDCYSIVKRIAKRAAMVPPTLYEVKDKKKFRYYQNLSYEQKQSNIDKYLTLKRESLGEEIEYHPILDVLETPNPNQSGIEHREQVYGYKLTVGDTFVLGVGPKIESNPNNGQIHEMWVLPAHYVKIIPDTNMLMGLVKGYEITNMKLTSDLPYILAEDVMHLKYWNPTWDVNGMGLYGLSPIKAGLRVLSVSNDTYEANAKLLQNMGAIGMVTNEDMESNDLTPEALEKLDSDYRKKYGGSQKYGKVLWTSQKLKWQQMGMPIDDLGVIEIKKYNLRDLCNIYNCPTIIFNENEKSSYNNMREARKDFVTDAVLPEVDNYYQGLNRWFIPTYKSNNTLWLDYEAEHIPELQPDMEKLSQRMEREWWWSPNEKRKMQGGGNRENEPNMDRIYVPSTMTAIDDLSIGELLKIQKAIDTELDGKL